MIKSTISQTEKKRTFRFPILMQHEELNHIVLFANKNEGTVVYSGDSELSIGHSDFWDIKAFIEYTGTITLKNLMDD